jgi:hypothetical protein
MKAQYNSTPPTLITNSITDLQVDSRGNLKVALFTADAASAPSTGTSADGNSNAGTNLYVDARNSVFNGTTWDREGKAFSTARLLSAAASTNATSVKASAGNVFKIVGVQVNAAARYLKLYNKATAPTVGTDTPIWTFYLPPTAVGGGLFTLDFGAQPLYFATGIGYALTTAAADADTGALTAGDVIAMNIAYA